MAKPKFRLVAKNKKTGASAEFGVIWCNDNNRMSAQFNTEEQARQSQGRKISGSNALAHASEFYFNVYDTANDKPRPAEGADTGEDIPF